MKAKIGMRVEAHDTTGNATIGEIVEVLADCCIVQDDETGELRGCPWPTVLAQLEPPAGCDFEFQRLMDGNAAMIHVKREGPEFVVTAHSPARLGEAFELRGPSMRRLYLEALGWWIKATEPQAAGGRR